jgi:hypothetical protein
MVATAQHIPPEYLPDGLAPIGRGLVDMLHCSCNKTAQSHGAKGVIGRQKKPIR